MSQPSDNVEDKNQLPLDTYSKKAVKSEIYAYKCLGKHSNIAEVYEISEEFIVLKKYKMNLFEAIIGEQELDKKQILQDISDGIMHMHRVGIAHNDLSPYNVMLDSDNRTVIIDFDSAAAFGMPQHKPGPSPWCKYNPLSEPDNDLHSLSKIALFVVLGATALDPFYGVVGRAMTDGVEMPDWYKTRIKHDKNIWTQYDWSRINPYPNASDFPKENLLSPKTHGEFSVGASDVFAMQKPCRSPEENDK